MKSKNELAEEILRVTNLKINPMRMVLHSDTSDWMRIKRGDILFLENKYFVVIGNLRETRFGIDEQPKMWVFRAVQLDNGCDKIIKTVFNEEFYAHIGIFRIRCYRSPEKESAVLDCTKDDWRFMQGRAFYDIKENNVRVIDFIRGKTFFHQIPESTATHEEYYHNELPNIFRKLLDSLLAIEMLHKNNLCHGDIRNDHIIIDADTQKYRWIDFDLKQDVSDFDLWSLGNIISYAVAKGIKSFDSVLKDANFSLKIKNSLNSEDGSAFYNYRIMNLKKLYPYISDRLSNILQHFTIKPITYYNNIAELIADYREMLDADFSK